MLAPHTIPLSNIFSLLCWNVHKEMGQHKFNQNFYLLQQLYNPDLILLQEAVLTPLTQQQLPQYTYLSAVNIKIWQKAFGVLTATKSSFSELLSLKTLHRELHIMTKKSLLITAHLLENENHLTVVNLHAINFVPASIFIKEIDRLLHHLSTIKGPLIVAGDFNTWHTKRLIHIETFANAIELTQAPLENANHIKHLFTKPLDHLYYRGLKLIEARAIDTKKISDHNPIYARFEIEIEEEEVKN